MASVTSLDKDMRKLRLDRYTPQAANEVRSFIEESLGERLAQGDLLESLKDGVALCKLVNLAAPNTLRFKAKAVMPFVQMENISLFLDACRNPPFNLQSHDMFLTVDLYESKDPAQVLQCIGAFSRAAHRIAPSHFPNPVGGKSRGGVMSPQGTGTGSGAVGGGSYGNRGRGVSNASNTSSAYNPGARAVALTPTKTGESNSGRWSPTKNGGTPLSPGGVSSWSKKSDEGATAPAWNIAQYGYMGGASQGNLGVSFGGRRQITSAGPFVPNMAEKEKKRREKEAEDERLRIQAEDEERRVREELIAEEERARVEEEARWAEESRKLREREKRKAEEEKRKWEEEEQRWRLEEERRETEEREAEMTLQEERKRARGNSDARLRGQFLSQYQAENGIARSNGDSSESSRIKELERELEMARERERQYERERQAKLNQRSRQQVEDHDMSNRIKAEQTAKVRSRSRSRPRIPERKSSDEQWRADEREYLRKQWSDQQSSESPNHTTPTPSKSPRPLPEPTAAPRLTKNNTGSRPLPDPAKYASSSKPSTPQTFSPPQNRTDRYLCSNPAPQPARSNATYSNEIGGFDSTAERDAEDRRRLQSQQKTKAGGWASKSLLEREMEMERQRQQEWEESQKEVKSKVASGSGVDGIGGGIGGKWDVNQWTGYTGGDGQNRGSQGIGTGRRQIVGPRPPPGR
ncbi:uncharacterized protein BP5553_01313 [Venustampulla echinocandica]|uniref:Calponin-homology (CH) domain-containing protein n=1 Tax=Venustampulla echinocandica TaxID=2656787 RepID=A0A370U0N1_9HELO|nr:uncharacterized protein BP5553_01313 [Venustampulla echinocandica]RDL41334.1 hypothetical protein BP5553_01313 [Venustampulla echinocandica]